jgi:hypothetical protein
LQGDVNSCESLAKILVSARGYRNPETSDREAELLLTADLQVLGLYATSMSLQIASK